MATRKKASTATQTAQVQAPALVMSPQHEQAVIMAALAIVEARLKVVTLTANAVEPVKNFLKLQLGALEREVFGVMFLNAQNRMIGDAAENLDWLNSDSQASAMLDWAAIAE